LLSAPAKLIAKSNLGVTDTSKDAEITAILTASAGTDSTGTTNYRPYLVAAYFLPLWSAISRSASLVPKAIAAHRRRWGKVVKTRGINSNNHLTTYLARIS